MPDYPPLTEEEQTTLEALQYQQALADWNAAETARLAELALFAPLDGLTLPADILTALTTIEESDVPQEFKDRIARIKTVVGIDMQAVFNRRDTLMVALPMPEDPNPEEPPA